MRPRKRKSITTETRRAVLHESGYRCANPGCRWPITLDIHHIEYVSEQGSDTAENLLPLCPNCHELHHSGQIPLESIRAWKMLLLSLNEGFSRTALDLLLALDHLGGHPVLVTTDTVLMMGSLVASGLVTISHPNEGQIPARDFSQTRFVSLSNKGSAFVAAWKAGNQAEAVKSVAGVK